MKINETIEALKEGKKIHRKGGNMYYYLDTYKQEIIGVNKDHSQPIKGKFGIAFGGREICGGDTGFEIYDERLWKEEEEEYRKHAKRHR